MKSNAASEEGAVTRLTGVGGRESRRQAYTDVFTASCRASDRTLTIPCTFICRGDDGFFMIVRMLGFVSFTTMRRED
ncbi:MAG: hypothetical protein IBX56_01915 [Methylomicrobium sp.]|nr:hypothetical protein [Methylomicrobium sp.]